ncbi:MAG: hypothetical protein R3C97_02070 [Geminicoccaceae bacterium]
MTEPATHDRPTPRALFELALCVADGGTAEEAARASGIAPHVAARLVGHWAFILLVRILPFLLGKRNRRSAHGDNPRSKRERTVMWKAAEPVLSQLAGVDWSLREELRHLRRRRAECRATADGDVTSPDVERPAESRRSEVTEAKRSFDTECPGTRALSRRWSSAAFGLSAFQEDTFAVRVHCAQNIHE